MGACAFKKNGWTRCRTFFHSFVYANEFLEVYIFLRECSYVNDIYLCWMYMVIEELIKLCVVKLYFTWRLTWVISLYVYIHISVVTVHLFTLHTGMYKSLITTITIMCNSCIIFCRGWFKCSQMNVNTFPKICLFYSLIVPVVIFIKCFVELCKYILSCLAFVQCNILYVYL